MTKEPIMIDDVDVSECKHLYTSIIPVGNDKIKCGLHQGKTCDNYPNCYYKQLKHKEQEYDELNKYRPIIDRLLQEFEKYEYIKSISTISYAKQVFEQLDQLEAANEKLKNKYHKATAKMTIKEIDQSNYIKQLEKTLNRIRTERDNYKQALQEIFKCLIMADRADKLTTDTLWIDNSTTLWDYIAQTLGLEGDQLEIEEQILQKCEVKE